MSMKIMYLRKIPEDLHREFKAMCAMNDISLNDMIVRLMRLYLDAQDLWEISDGVNTAAFEDLFEGLWAMGLFDGKKLTIQKYTHKPAENQTKTK